MIRITAAFVLGAVLVVDPPAYADPVTITGGRLAFDDGDPPSFRVEIASSPFLLGGVWLDPNPGSNSVLSLAPDSAIGCLFIAACVGGDVVSLGATISGTGAGTVGPQADPENPSIRPIVATFHFTTPGALVVDQPGDLFLTHTGPLRDHADRAWQGGRDAVEGRGERTVYLGREYLYLRARTRAGDMDAARNGPRRGVGRRPPRPPHRVISQMQLAGAGIPF
jgi:hypothetical protein